MLYYEVVLQEIKPVLLKCENMAKCIKHDYNDLHCDICIITIRWVKKGNSKDAY